MKKNPALRSLSLILALLMLLSLCACGKRETASYYYEPAAPGTYAAGNSYYAANESVMADYYAEDASVGFSATSMKNTVTGSGEQTDAPDANPEKIIYSSDVTLESTDYDAAIEGVNALLAQFGGYIESSSSSNGNYSTISRGNRYNRSSSFTLRVPSVHFNEIMSSFSTLGNIPHSYTYTENVTAQYYDVQARLNAYTVQENTLLELMEKAESVEDILTIQARLTEVRYTIESLQSSLNNWDRRVSYSTINLSVQEVTVYTPIASPTFGERISEAFFYGFASAGDFLESLLLWLLESLPTLIILGLFLWVIIRVIRSLHRKSVARRAARGEAPKQKKLPFLRRKDSAAANTVPGAGSAQTGSTPEEK